LEMTKRHALHHESCQGARSAVVVLKSLFGADCHE
jgi:hypothetical protein